MFLPIREGIAEVLQEFQQLRQDTEYTEGWARSFEYQLPRSRKWKRLKPSQWRELGEGPNQKEPPEAKPKPEAKKPKWQMHARPEAVLIKQVEGVSYAAI